MRTIHAFTTSWLWLAMAISALGVSVEISVTPTNLDQQKYTFAVSKNVETNGATFEVSVTAKQADIPADSSVAVSVAKHATETNGSITCSISAAEPPIKISTRREKRIWKANFFVSRDQLRAPGLCFILTELSHITANGKIVTMPSAEFYELTLSDFLADKPSEGGNGTNIERFTVSIAGLRQSNKAQYERGGLPLVYCSPSDHRSSLGSAMDLPGPQCFFVIVRNAQNATNKIAQCLSEWDGCLSFAISDSPGKTYSIRRRECLWTANVVETWVFPPDGMRVIPVDFTSGGWEGLPSIPSEPKMVTMTVTFHYYDSLAKMVSVTSGPNNVYLCHK